MSLKVFVESLREVLDSGPRVMSIPARAMSIVSTGERSTMLSPFIYPFRSAFEKLYMFACDILMVPSMPAISLPLDSICSVSGRNTLSESNAADILPFTLNAGSLPRRSCTLPLALNPIPAENTSIVSRFMSISPLLPVSACIFMNILMSLSNALWRVFDSGTFTLTFMSGSLPEMWS